MIDPARLALMSILHLAKGAHPAPDGTFDDGGLCVMETVAWVAGKPWSDAPACACPVIATFLRHWNDGATDDDRTRLLAPLQ